MPSDSRDEATVVPADVYDAMQASLDEPDRPNPALADAAAKARSIVAMPTVDECRAAAEAVLARGYVSTTVYGLGAAEEDDGQDRPGEHA